MIYRYDQPVDMPIPELYDTGIMNAYLNAVKDQYESGEKRMDEYLSKYSDFTSPFQQDVKDYDRLVYGRMNNLLDDLQKEVQIHYGQLKVEQLLQGLYEQHLLEIQLS